MQPDEPALPLGVYFGVRRGREVSSPSTCGTGRKLLRPLGQVRPANPSMGSPAVGTGDGLAGGEGSEGQNFGWLCVYLHAGTALCSPAGMGWSARQQEQGKPPCSPASSWVAAVQLEDFASERLNYLWISRAVPTRVCSAARTFCWMSWSFAPAARNSSWDLFGSQHLEEVLGWLGRYKPCE